jgi:hypothetical protein
MIHRSEIEQFGKLPEAEEQEEGYGYQPYRRSKEIEGMERS